MTTTAIESIALVPLSETASRFWMARAGYGLLLGAAIALLEFAAYAPLLFTRNELSMYSVALLLVWCGEGVLLLLVLGLAERGMRPRDLGGWRLVLAIVAGVLFSVLTWQTFCHMVLREVLEIRLFTDRLGQPVAWMGGVLYHFWMVLFFGALATAVYVAKRWRVRMQAALRAAELGYATSQQRLAEAGLAALQAQVDPVYLLQTLARLEQLYESDPDAADRLLDELIAFLRGALTDIRASAMSASRRSQSCHPT